MAQSDRRVVIDFLAALASPWTWRMAWRDSRRNRGRLLLYCSAIVLGVAALAAIGSVGRSLQGAVQTQAKSLLGSDLVVSSREPFTAEEEELLASIPGRSARDTSFSSMAVFPRVAATRFVQVRGLERGFPFYGALETSPTNAPDLFHEKRGALLDEAILLQFGLQIGDEVRLGNWSGRIEGVVRRIPGESLVFSQLAPRVYVPHDVLAQTGLLRPESLARYQVHYRLEAEDTEIYVRALKPQLEKLRLSFDTVTRRTESLGRTMERWRRFLNLVGLMALILGGVGIASSIHVYVKQRLGTVAILRCLGSNAGQAFSIYFVQALALAMAGVLGGLVLGVLVQGALPRILTQVMPIRVESRVSVAALAEAGILGLSAGLLFAGLPLLSIRRVSPLAVLRASRESHARPGRDPAVWLLGGVIAIGVTWFAIASSENWKQGLGYSGGLGAAFLLLSAVAKGLIAVARRLTPASWPYVWRQGVANLHRPNNRTLLLIVSLGLGVFLLVSLALVKGALVRELLPSREQSRGNMVLFDVQPDRVGAVRQWLREHQLPVLQETPIVTMRLREVNGTTVEKLAAQRERRRGRWALFREYRSTFRDQVGPSERLIKGEWVGRASSAEPPVPVSVEEGIAEELGVGLGDELTFDVQGISIVTRVASLREVEWRRLEPNFFVVFPLGILEDAPAFYVLVTRVESAEISAEAQRDLVREFPEISVIDLRLVLDTVNGILDRIGRVIRFLAFFTIGTGALVAAAALLTGQYQRVQESALLRTLGASRGQVRSILAIEYVLLGLLAAGTGGALAVAAAVALCAFVFEIAFAFDPTPLLVGVAATVALTCVVGLLSSRNVLEHPPLAVLQAEDS